MRKILLAAAAGLMLTTSFVACGEAEEEVDCLKICQKYESCVDSNYDVSECQDRCEDNTDNVSGYESRADACESCIDGDTSCTEAGFNCGDECSGIVP